MRSESMRKRSRANSPPNQGFADRAANPFGSIGVLGVYRAVHGLDYGDGEKDQDGLSVSFRKRPTRRGGAGGLRARHKLDIYSVYSENKKNFHLFFRGVYNAHVPNVRASGQKQVIVIMSEEFLSDIDGSIETLGYSNRAEFIRQAVLEKLAKAGVQIEKSKAAAPSRAGKGGRPKKV